MISYWEQQSFTQYDHTIIGAGIVGLNLAIELQERYPTSRILVLERGLLPTGASTRNAGFACMGSATELLDDLEHSTEAEVVALFAARKEGLSQLRTRLGDGPIGYKEDGSYELLSAANLQVLEQLDYLNHLLQPITRKPAFVPAPTHQATTGFSAQHVAALVNNTCEGSLDSGKMMRALLHKAQQMGVELKTGAEVVRYDENEHGVDLTIQDPYRREAMLLHSGTLSLCTNAFTKALMPDVDVTPGRGQVLVTDPVPGLKFKGTYHFDKGYYYFRELDGRVLLGGGRNLDFAGERTTAMDLNKQIQADLEQKLATIILPNTPHQIAIRWAGIMAFGATKTPIVQSFSDRVFGAFRMGGMGVALGCTAAARLAGIIDEKL